MNQSKSKTSTNLRFFLSALLISLFCLSPLNATEAETQPFTAQWLAKTESVTPGETLQVAILFDVAEGWHAYAEGEGEAAGLPVEISWELPEGFEVGKIQHTPSAPLKTDFGLANVYEGQGAFLAEVKVPQNISLKEPLVLKANVTWLACGTSCVPGSTPLELTLPVSENAGAENPSWQKTAAPLLLKLTDQDSNQVIGGTDQLLVGADSFSWAEFGLALLTALIGGLLLNLMPCVLPVISFKIMGFITLANDSRRQILLHSLAFFWGVIVSYWILAGLLLSLRAYGESVGWGFQLQEPIFVGALALFLFIFAMSLFGLFELGTGIGALAGQHSVRQSAENSNFKKLAGSFLNGALATAVATPCTGPFLGTTLGFTVTLPTIFAMAIFTMMGVGMALPYLLIGCFPSLLRFLPKPGAWMVVFKELMGFIIVITVLWLVFVFGGLTDFLGTFLLLAALVIAAMACWIYGRLASPLNGQWTRRISTGIALLLLVGSGSLLMQASGQTTSPHSSVEKNSQDSWVPFSLEKLSQLKAEGKTVFIDFTASWCLICQSNKMVLHGAKVDKMFREKGVVTMLADWTKRDEVIANFLMEHQRNGVPFYLMLTPGDEEPTIFPQLLTQDLVLEKLAGLPQVDPV